MGTPLADRLTVDLPDLTKSAKAIASFMRANLNSLPFETAASIAKADSKLRENFEFEMAAIVGVCELRETA